MSNNFYIPSLKKESMWFYIFIGIAILIPFLALIIPWMPEGETLASWFQRSGSAMVIFALLAESRAIRIYNILNPSGFVELGFNEAKDMYEKHPLLFSTSSFLLISVGTLIWGYGDILLKNT